MIRIGLGHDTHRLGAARPLRLGGVLIPHESGPVAHSDGDVLLHALIDALLGAAALGDIGEWFPDTDPAWRDADSAALVTEVSRRVRSAGWQVVNVDAIVFAQRPKLGPHKLSIRRRIAELLGLSETQVSVKAKTGEGVGPIGREEAIAAEVVVLVESLSDPTSSPC